MSRVVDGLSGVRLAWRYVVGLDLEMNMILFVGERRSPRAKTLGLTWKDGGLAAKPLFEALHACGIDPQCCRFVNLFERSGPRTVRDFPGAIVGMGRKVQARLARMGIKHTPIVHPAARGSIRKRERYISHVKAALI